MQRLVAGLAVETDLAFSLADPLPPSAVDSDFYRYDVPARVLRYDIPGRSLRFDVSSAALTIDA